jgi:hypothetical protein
MGGSVSVSAEDELALRALSTPSVEAPAALDVLIDVLLEGGMISDDLSVAGVAAFDEEPTNALRRRAFQWAKRRHAPIPNPMQQLVAIVIDALEDRRAAATSYEFPHAVVGVVAPFNVRIHFMAPVGPDLRLIAREAVAQRLPVPVVIDVTSRD